jgi:hypothetical protein
VGEALVASLPLHEGPEGKQTVSRRTVGEQKRKNT